MNDATTDLRDAIANRLDDAHTTGIILPDPTWADRLADDLLTPDGPLAAYYDPILRALGLALGMADDYWPLIPLAHLLTPAQRAACLAAAERTP